MEEYDRADLERLWAAVVGAITLVLVVGSVLFPRTVWDRFLWQYFWGPVAADGRGEACLARENGETIVPDSCAAATGIVAEPGYTLLSTVSYAIVLVSMLVGVYFLIQRLDVLDRVTALYPLLPWVLFGGALRTVEDASIQLMGATGSPAIPFPYTAAIISPFIYFTVFGLTVLALVASVRAADRGLVERYEYPLAAGGTALLAAAVGYLAYLAVTTDVLTFNPSVLIVTLLGAAAVAAAVWYATEEYAPVVNTGTGTVGALIVWGHTVDGIANVLSLDWGDAFGLPTYSPKHVVNAGIRDVTSAVQPAWLTEAIGITWPFIPVKVAAAVLVVWLFNDEIVEESPHYSVLLLLAVLAVGLGPGTRDMLRAAFGI